MNFPRFLLFCLLPPALGLPVRADFIAVGPGQISRVNEQTGAAQILNSTPSITAYLSLTRDPQTRSV